MTKTRLTQIVTGIFVIGIILVFVINLNGQGDIARVGDEAADFQLEGQNGELYQLSDYEGKPVVLSFFTTWCTSCKAQTPEMIQFQEEFADDVQVFTIVKSESKRAVEKYIEETGYADQLYIFDFDQEVSGSYGITGQPETVIIDGSGVVVDHIVGPVKKGDVTEKVSDLTI